MESGARSTRKVMGNRDRLVLLCFLTLGEYCVGELLEVSGVVQPTLSQQLGVLERVKRRADRAGASVFLLLNGRIAGISGIAGGLLSAAKGDSGWHIAFLAGLIGSPLLGTRYGSGCTSGHGVCGIARLSPRSLAATAAFMLAGFATVFLVRHLFA